MNTLDESIAICDGIARDLGPEPELVLPLPTRLRTRARVVSALDCEAADEIERLQTRVIWLVNAQEINVEIIANQQRFIRELEKELSKRKRA